MTGSITSAKNPLLKSLRRAIARGGLTEDGLAVAEGFHLLHEARRSGCAIVTIIASESAAPEVASRARGLSDTRLLTLPDALFHGISSTDAPQGVISLVRPPAWTLEDTLRGSALVLVLDGLQEPGNAGAILRAAEAFGATGAVLLKGAVSPYNPKALRASAGSLFRLPCVTGAEVPDLIAAIEQKGIALFAALPAFGGEPSSADFRRPCALVIGSEAHGVSEGLTRRATPLTIPTAGVESLNAAVAAGILLYEARRQRMRDR
jgi:TrmH family RNA methyltransferase